MEQLMTSEEAAEFLHVDPVTIRRLITKGELSAYRIGTDYRIAPSDLASYLQRQRINAKSDPHEESSPLNHIKRWITNKANIPSEKTDNAKQHIEQLKLKFRYTFTRKTKRVLDIAEDEALKYNHNYIGTEHLLLALLIEGKGIAAQALQHLGLTTEKAGQTLEFLLAESSHKLTTTLQITPRAKKILQLAHSEARINGSEKIDTEHLLLGILAEGEGIAIGILESHQLTVKQVREEILHLISQQKNIEEHIHYHSDPSTGERPLYICGTCQNHSTMHAHYCSACGSMLINDDKVADDSNSDENIY